MASGKQGHFEQCNGKDAAAAAEKKCAAFALKREFWMDLRGERAVVCGAGGFIGGHLVKSLRARGIDVLRAVDVKPVSEWYQVSGMRMCAERGVAWAIPKDQDKDRFLC